MDKERRLRYNWIFILLLAFVVPLSQFISIRLLMLGVVLSFFVGGNRDALTRYFAIAWDKLLLFGVLLFGIIYSDDKVAGWRTIETSVALVAFPFVVCQLESMNAKKLNEVFLAFALGVLIACSICFFNALTLFSLDRDTSVFFFEKLTGIISLQPTYLAYYIIFVITFGIYLSWYEKGISLLISIPALVFLFMVLLLTGGNTALISLLLIFSFFMLKWILEPRNARVNKLMLTITAMLVAIFLVHSFFYWGNQPMLTTDYWERSALWEAAIRATTNPLIGVGTGDNKVVLNDYYRLHDLAQFAEESFNAHNEFIQRYLGNGLLGLAALIIVLTRPLFVAIRYHDVFGKLVFFPFIIYGMNEVFLGRFQGVIFFGFVNTLFHIYYFHLRPPLAKPDKNSSVVV